MYDNRMARRGNAGVPERAPAVPRSPAVRAASPTVLALQRTAGNAAVVQLLDRQRQSNNRGDSVPLSTGLPAVQRVPEETPRPAFDWESGSESDSETAVGTENRGSTALPYHRKLRSLWMLIDRAAGAGDVGSFAVTVKVDPGSSWLSRDFFNGEVGHVWLEVESPLGGSSSFGFYPADVFTDFRSVPGTVCCPDTHGGVREQRTVQVGLDEMKAAYRLAYSRLETSYNVITYNCASFASEVWKTMTGAALVTGLVVSNPASAAEAIRAERERAELMGGQKNVEEMERLLFALQASVFT